MTRFGRNRSIGTGRGARSSRSGAFSSRDRRLADGEERVAVRKPDDVARPGAVPASPDGGRRAPCRTSLQGAPMTPPSHEAGASPQSSARRPSLYQTRTGTSAGAADPGARRTRISPNPSRGARAQRRRERPRRAPSGAGSAGSGNCPPDPRRGTCGRRRRRGASTPADWTANPRSDFTGWMFRAARCMRALRQLFFETSRTSTSTLSGPSNSFVPPRAERLELAGARQELLLERADRRVEVQHGAGEPGPPAQVLEQVAIRS